MAEERKENLETEDEELLENETLEPSIEEEAEEKEEQEEKQEAVVDWEKRYKDLQSQKDKEVGKYKDLVAPFAENIRDDDGKLSFDFKKKEKVVEEDLDLPTDEEWIKSPSKAGKKQFDYYEQQRTRNDKARTQQESTKQAEKNYIETRGESWGKVQESYPEANNKESKLFIRAQEILDEDPDLVASPYCDSIAIKLAAAELGMAPKKKSPSKNKGDNTSYIIDGGSGNGKESSKMTDEEFFNLSEEEQRKEMKDEVLGKGG